MKNYTNICVLPNGRIYKDGVKQKRLPRKPKKKITNVLRPLKGHTSVYWVNNRFFVNGTWVDNVHCVIHYDRALTSAEVQQNYNAMKVRFKTTNQNKDEH